MLVGQTASLDEVAPLNGDEYEAVIKGTSLLYEQVQKANPLVERRVLHSAHVGMVLGEILRQVGTLKRYRELLDRVEAEVAGETKTLSATLVTDIRESLHPERPRLIIPGAS